MVTSTNSSRSLAGKGGERRRYLEEHKGEDCMLGEGGRAPVLRERDRLERQQGGQLVRRPLKTSEWMVSTVQWSN